MRTSNLLLKLNVSMNSVARRTMWKVSLTLLFLALIVYVLSQPMQAGRFRFATDAAFASKSANKTVTGGDIAQSNTCFPTPAGLVSRWTGEGNATDLGGGNHGQLEGGAAYATGQVGKAFTAVFARIRIGRLRKPMDIGRKFKTDFSFERKPL